MKHIDNRVLLAIVAAIIIVACVGALIKLGTPR
jgi:hypothetical protein